MTKVLDAHLELRNTTVTDKGLVKKQNISRLILCGKQIMLKPKIHNRVSIEEVMEKPVVGFIFNNYELALFCYC